MKTLLALVGMLAVGSCTMRPALAQEIQFDRTGHVRVLSDGRLVDIGPHAGNPFPNEAACRAGLEDDKATVVRFFLEHGVDSAVFEVIVDCKPSGRPA